MHDFRYLRGRLVCERVPLETLARRFGTPLFVYSHRTLATHYRKLDRALRPLDHWVCYAVKANSNLGVMVALARLGSAFDIVSGGELLRVKAAGGDPERCVFAGVGKSEAEIELALRERVYSINIESEPELRRVSRVARRLRIQAPIAIRVNPNIDAHTNSKITTGTYENKFGIAFEEVEALYDRAARLPNLRLKGVQMHIGSQVTDATPFKRAVRRLLPLVRELKQRHPIEFFSIGGGLGIVYSPALESGARRWWRGRRARGILTAESYAEAIVPLLRPLGLRILIEPGRFIVGNAGVLVTRVEFVKRTGRKSFVIVDAAMNDLIRPAFYEAYHEIVPLHKPLGRRHPSDVVGPVCESGDMFCRDRPMPAVGEGDYVAILSAGAYGFVMASNYNTRPLAAEVMVSGKRSALVRKRQAVTAIWKGESVPDWA